MTKVSLYTHAFIENISQDIKHFIFAELNKIA